MENRSERDPYAWVGDSIDKYQKPSRAFDFLNSFNDAYVGMNQVPERLSKTRSNNLSNQLDGMKTQSGIDAYTPDKQKYLQEKSANDVTTGRQALVDEALKEKYTETWNREMARGGDDAAIHDRVTDALKGDDAFSNSPLLQGIHAQKGREIFSKAESDAMARQDYDSVNRYREKSGSPYRIVANPDGSYAELKDGKVLRQIGTKTSEAYDPKIHKTLHDIANEHRANGRKEEEAVALKEANNYYERTNPTAMRQRKEQIGQELRRKLAFPIPQNVPPNVPQNVPAWNRPPAPIMGNPQQTMQQPMQQQGNPPLDLSDRFLEHKKNVGARRVEAPQAPQAPRYKSRFDVAPMPGNPNALRDYWGVK